MIENYNEIKDFILRSMNFRYACKEYDPYRKIAKDDLDIILEAGRLSPSSLGFMPMKFIVIEQKPLRDELLPFCSGAKTQLPTSSHFIIILSRTASDLLPDSQYIYHNLNDVQNLPKDVCNMYLDTYTQFFNEKFDDGKDTRAIFDWSSKQSYIALGNMMTVAAQLCIDSCAIEGFNKDEVENILCKHNLIDKDHFEVSVMLSLGYRKDDRSNDKDKKRPLKEEIITFI